VRRRVLGLVLVVASASGCGGAESATEPPGDSFIAFASSFADFRTWPSYPVTETEDATHTTGPRTEYLNQTPAHGSKEFPVGTIVVKESDAGALADRQIFAMVKRGASYNASGAKDWEWFELRNVDAARVTIVWRGVGPPAGETYGGDANGGCNTCHAEASTNDYVRSKALQLSGF
jgi:hypothetical protein